MVNLGAALADPAVWRALLVAILVGALALLIGRFVAMRVGILDPAAPDAEVLGIGLSTGLLVITALGASIASGGRSAFAPVAAAILIALALTLRPAGAITGAPGQQATRLRRLPLSPLTISCAIVFVVGIALLFAVTMAPSPRDGVQPVEFMDDAFYSILGRDMVSTGTEAFYAPSGFGPSPGLPSQNWYHWGELWLAGGVGWALGVEPSFARHLVVLPLLLLAIAGVVGSIARRSVGSTSRPILVLGASASLLLAPIPILGTNNYFTTWASGMLFSITMYGLAAVAITLLMLLVLRGRDIPAERGPTAVFIAALVAMVLPSHVALALLGGAGACVAVTVLTVQLRLERGRMSRPPRTALVLGGLSVGLIAVTLAWGTATGHGVLGSGASPRVEPFGDVWVEAIAATAAGAVVLLAIPIAWLLVRRRQHDLAAMLMAAMSIVGGGAIAWGLRLGEFTMFHVFYGAIVVFATPMAVAAIVVLWARLRDGGRGLIALALIAVTVFQVQLGVFSSGSQLIQFAARGYQPVPLEIMSAIRGLESEAKIGYACHQREELVYWDPRLLSIDLHTARRIIPLCFQADILGPMVGGDVSREAVAPQFALAPQSELFPTADTQPTPAEVSAFMRRQGIGYLYVDATHPNSLVPEAVPVIVRGDTRLLRLP
jgi:hypothetical protein